MLFNSDLWPPAEQKLEMPCDINKIDLFLTMKSLLTPKMRHVISHLLGNFFIMQLSHKDIQMKEVFSENKKYVKYELTIFKDEL